MTFVGYNYIPMSYRRKIAFWPTYLLPRWSKNIPLLPFLFHVPSQDELVSAPPFLLCRLDSFKTSDLKNMHINKKWKPKQE